MQQKQTYCFSSRFGGKVLDSETWVLMAFLICLCPLLSLIFFIDKICEGFSFLVFGFCFVFGLCVFLILKFYTFMVLYWYSEFSKVIHLGGLDDFT